MTKIEYIKQRCIEANHEIMELKFGCLLQDERRGLRIPITKEKYNGDLMIRDWDGWLTPEWIKENYKVIGRPPQLADVLHALGMGWYDQSKEMRNRLERIIVLWDLTKTLDDQPEPVINYLADLLGFKE